MYRFLKMILFSFILGVTMSFSSMAANNYSTYNPINQEVHLRGWIKDSKGWRYFLTNNQYYKNEWRWINSSDYHKAYCYYFDQNGYIYLDTITPDGYFVNANGEWYDPITKEVWTKESYEIYTANNITPATGIITNQGTSIIDTTGIKISNSGASVGSSRSLRNNIADMQNVSIIDKVELNGTTHKNLICFDANGAWLTVKMGKYTKLKLKVAVKDSYIDETAYRLLVFVNDEEIDEIDFDSEKYERLENYEQDYELECDEGDTVMLYFTYTETNRWLKKKLYITSGVLQKK